MLLFFGCDTLHPSFHLADCGAERLRRSFGIKRNAVYIFRSRGATAILTPDLSSPGAALCAQQHEAYRLALDRGSIGDI